MDYSKDNMAHGDALIIDEEGKRTICTYFMNK